jgi:dUTPase
MEMSLMAKNLPVEERKLKCVNGIDVQTIFEIEIEAIKNSYIATSLVIQILDLSTIRNHNPPPLAPFNRLVMYHLTILMKNKTIANIIPRSSNILEVILSVTMIYKRYI